MAKEYIRLNTRLDVWKDKFNDLTNDVGDIALLSTGDTLGGDSDLVTAINELDSDIGPRPHSALTTISKNLTSAINELDSDMGKPKTGLTTVARTVTGAINELDVRITGEDQGFVARARSTISATTSGTGYGGLTYDDSDGVITYAKVTAANIRGRFTGGNAITYNSSTGSIAVTANAIEAAELNVSGNGNSGQALISDGDGTFSWGRKVPNIYDSDGTLLN